MTIKYLCIINMLCKKAILIVKLILKHIEKHRRRTKKKNKKKVYPK